MRDAWGYDLAPLPDPSPALWAYEGNTPTYERARVSACQNDPDDYGPSYCLNPVPHPLRGLPYHFYHVIHASLPQLKSLHIHLPNHWASLFRDHEAKNDTDTDPDPPLPKLKEIVINLALPFHAHFIRNQACHCVFETKIADQTVECFGYLLAEEMKHEVTRLLERMDNPKLVCVRYPRTVDNFGVDKKFVHEWDALTGENHLRAIDSCGVVKDLKT